MALEQHYTFGETETVSIQTTNDVKQLEFMNTSS
jgi:hypothetical protein